MNTIFKHLRLIPAVLLLGSGLLALKGFGLALEARAESAPSQEQTAPATDTPPISEDEQENASAAEVDVLTGLASRRAELDKREQYLAMRENLIAAAEKRVEGRITALKQLQGDIEGLLGKRDEAEQKQLAALVKTYSTMKPKDAARIFNSLDEKVLLDVAQAMKPDVLGAIMAAMQPTEAQKLTVKLANRFKIPDHQAQTPAQQVASLAPQATPPGTTPPAPADATQQPLVPQPAAQQPPSPADAGKQAATTPATTPAKPTATTDAKQPKAGG